MKNQQKPEALEDHQVRKLAAIGAVRTSSGIVERRPIEYRRELEDQFVRGFRAAESRLAALVEAQQPAPAAAPEALRPEMLDDLIEAFATAGLGRHNLMRVELPRRQWAQLAVALSRLHAENERPAALVAAQQPAPAAVVAFDEHGFRDWVLRNLPNGSIIGNGEWWADHLTSWAKRFVKAAPQPSPTPQADSQPAPVQDEREAFETWYCDQMRAAGYNADDGIANLREDNHYGEHRVMLNGKWEGWQARAARAPADSVTAPAGWVVRLSKHKEAE